MFKHSYLNLKINVTELSNNSILKFINLSKEINVHIYNDKSKYHKLIKLLSLYSIRKTIINYINSLKWSQRYKLAFTKSLLASNIKNAHYDSLRSYKYNTKITGVKKSIVRNYSLGKHLLNKSFHRNNYNYSYIFKKHMHSLNSYKYFWESKGKRIGVSFFNKRNKFNIVYKYSTLSFLRYYRKKRIRSLNKKKKLYFKRPMVISEFRNLLNEDTTYLTLADRISSYREKTRQYLNSYLENITNLNSNYSSIVFFFSKLSMMAFTYYYYTKLIKNNTFNVKDKIGVYNSSFLLYLVSFFKRGSKSIVLDIFYNYYSAQRFNNAKIYCFNNKCVFYKSKFFVINYEYPQSFLKYVKYNGFYWSNISHLKIHSKINYFLKDSNKNLYRFLDMRVMRKLFFKLRYKPGGRIILYKYSSSFNHTNNILGLFNEYTKRHNYKMSYFLDNMILAKKRTFYKYGLTGDYTMFHKLLFKKLYKIDYNLNKYKVFLKYYKSPVRKSTPFYIFAQERYYRDSDDINLEYNIRNFYKDINIYYFFTYFKNKVHLHVVSILFRYLKAIRSNRTNLRKSVLTYYDNDTIGTVIYNNVKKKLSIILVNSTGKTLYHLISSSIIGRTRMTKAAIVMLTKRFLLHIRPIVSKTKLFYFKVLFRGFLIHLRPFIFAWRGSIKYNLREYIQLWYFLNHVKKHLSYIKKKIMSLKKDAFLKLSAFMSLLLRFNLAIDYLSRKKLQFVLLRVFFIQIRHSTSYIK